MSLAEILRFASLKEAEDQEPATASIGRRPGGNVASSMSHGLLSRKAIGSGIILGCPTRVEKSPKRRAQFPSPPQPSLEEMRIWRR